MIRVTESVAYPVRPLDEVAEVLDYLRRPINAADRANRVGPYPYYGANGRVGCIDEFIFDEDLVLVAEDGGFFFDDFKPISYRISGKTWVNNHAHVLRPKPGIEVDWLNYAIAYQDLRHLINGTTRAKLNQRELKEVLIPVPPPSEQRRLIPRIHDCIVRVEEISQLQRQAKVELDALLCNVIDAFVDTTWPKMSLHELCTEIRNGWSGKQDLTGVAVGVLRLSCVHGLEVDPQDTKGATVSSSAAAEYAIRAGDVFVVRGNGSRRLVGRSAIVTEGRGDVIFNDLLIRLRLKQTVLPSFVNLLFHTAEVRQQIEGLAKTAAGIWKINQTNLGRVELRCPTTRVQAEFVASVTEARQACSKIQRLWHTDTAQLAETVVRQAFAGEL